MITKGPWDIDKNDDTGCWVVVDANGKEIYSVAKSESDWENVCLARSGPYLMEALEEILAALDPNGDHPFFGKARVSLQYAKLTKD